MVRAHWIVPDLSQIIGPSSWARWETIPSNQLGYLCDGHGITALEILRHLNVVLS
jgi:hypothetical protein